MILPAILSATDHSHAYLIVGTRIEHVAQEIEQLFQNSPAELRAFAQLLSPIEDKIDVEATRAFRQAFNLQGVATLTLGVIHEIDKMTLPAQQMLLKLLEEAPPRVVFLLTTTKPKILPRPLLSRVRVVHVPDQAVVVDERLQAQIEQLFAEQTLLFEKQTILEKMIKKHSIDDVLYYLSLYLWRHPVDQPTLQKWFDTLSYIRHASTLRNGLEYFFLT